jgi:hypothetical protein
VETSDDATTFRVAGNIGRKPQGRNAAQKTKRVSTLGWYDAIPLGLAKRIEDEEEKSEIKIRITITIMAYIFARRKSRI